MNSAVMKIFHNLQAVNDINLSAEYHKLLEEYVQMSKSFISGFSEEKGREFRILDDLATALSTALVKCYFEAGFKLGVRLGVESAE